jgi:hypothetical protein
MNYILKTTVNKLDGLINHERYSVGSAEDVFDLSSKSYLFYKENETYFFYKPMINNGLKFNRSRYFEMKFTILNQNNSEINVKVNLVVEPFITTLTILLFTLILIAGFVSRKTNSDDFFYICIFTVSYRGLSLLFVNRNKLLEKYVEELETLIQ